MHREISAKDWGRGLYGIVDMRLIESQRMTLEEAAGALILAGAPVVQLRFKSAGGAELLEAARLLVALCRRHGARSIVNDRVDVAVAAGADGVHLGQDDLSVAAARAMLPAGSLVGYSTHDLPQVREALEAGADYIGFGPIFSTSTKANADPVVGIEGLAEATSLVAQRIPVVAIGGIELSSVPSVASAGADMAAVISDILVSEDPAGQAAAVHRAMLGGLYR